MIITIILILSIINALLLYGVFNLIKVNEKQEEFILSMVSNLNNAFSVIKNIDRTGAFEVDDEVGDVYRIIRSEIIKINEFILEESNSEDTGED